MEILHIFYSVYEQIIERFKNSPIESGGILATDDNGAICDFYFCAGNNESEFIISPDIFNSKIGEWYIDKKMFAGIIHSHPNGLTILSDNDKKYAEKVLELNPFLSNIIMGIIAFKGEVIKLKFYTVRKGSCKESKLEIV